MPGLPQNHIHMKKLISLLVLALSMTSLPAQNHRGPTNPTGQITRVHQAKLKMKGHGEFAAVIADTAIDLEPYAPKIMRQPYKDCYAYATVYTARTLLYNINRGITSSPDSTVFAPGFLQQLIYPDNNACRSNGDDIYNACAYLRDVGIVFRSDYPNDCNGDPITPALRTKAANYRINALQLYHPCDDAAKKIAAIKSSIAQHRPVVIAWLSRDSFNGGGYNVDCWQPTRADRRRSACSKGANHAICVIGYSDHKFNGAFHIRNTWSTDWGEKDKNHKDDMWITYADMAQFSAYAVEFSEKTP